MTTEALWCHVIENAGDDERVGVEASGQQLLLEDTVVSSEETRDLRDTPAGRRSRARQATLTGKIVDRRVVRSQHELDWARVNALKGVTVTTTVRTPPDTRGSRVCRRSRTTTGRGGT